MLNISVFCISMILGEPCSSRNCKSKLSVWIESSNILYKFHSFMHDGNEQSNRSCEGDDPVILCWSVRS